MLNSIMMAYFKVKNKLPEKINDLNWMMNNLNWHQMALPESFLYCEK